jgi:hypothetical protein
MIRHPIESNFYVCQTVVEVIFAPGRSRYTYQRMPLPDNTLPDPSGRRS